MKIIAKKENFISILLIITYFGIFQGCKKEETYFSAPIITSKNIQINSLSFDTVHFDHIPSSYVGEFYQFSDTIYFVDKMFCTVYLFNQDGKHLNRHLGSGGGPNEIPSGYICAFQRRKSGSYLVLGPSHDLYSFNAKWERTNLVILKKEIIHSEKEMSISPKPSMQGIYGIDYEKNMNLQEFGSNILIPAEALHDNFNPTMKEYYEHSRIFFEIDVKNGHVVNMLGRRSPFYLNYNFIGQFSWFHFDVSDNDKLYVCYEPDSLIYVFNQDMENIETFGISGLNMDTNYTESTSFEQTGKMLYTERKDRGYYTGLKYVDASNLLFRSYQKGKHSKTDGLQIYKGNTLIADVDVPKGFKLMGYSKPYFYSEGFIDEDYEKAYVLKFKIDSLIQ